MKDKDYWLDIIKDYCVHGYYLTPKARETDVWKSEKKEMDKWLEENL